MPVDGVLLERPAHEADEHPGHDERDDVGDDRRRPPERLAEQPAQAGADGEHDAPRRAEQGVGGAQLVGRAGEVGDGCVDRRFDERGEGGDGALEHEGHPDAVLGEQQEAGRGERLQRADDDE